MASIPSRNFEHIYVEKWLKKTLQHKTIRRLLETCNQPAFLIINQTPHVSLKFEKKDHVLWLSFPTFNNGAGIFNFIFFSATPVY